MQAHKRGRIGSLAERTLRTFWALPLLLIAASFAITVALLFADRAGAAGAVAEWGPPFDIPADTAADLASTVLSIAVALTSLMFSITLIVLTIAASNLGVRFVDRWVRARITRLSIGVYPALVAAALLVLYAIEEGPAPFVPRLSLLALVAAFAGGLVWLVAAFHHLSRLMHVDVSLASIARDVRADTRGERFDPRSAVTEREATPCAAAHKTGYVEAFDTRSLADACEAAGARAVILQPVGAFVTRGVPLLGTLGAVSPDARARLRDASARFVDIIGVRRESEGARFQVNLLVEAAIRALSPAVNDQYTAIDAAHRLAACFAAGFEIDAPPPGALLDAGGRGVLHYPPVSVLSALDEALVVFRRTARDHPSVTCAFLEHAAAVLPLARSAEGADLLLGHAELLARETLDASRTAFDREAVERRIAALRRAAEPAAPGIAPLPRAA